MPRKFSMTLIAETHTMRCFSFFYLPSVSQPLRGRATTSSALAATQPPETIQDLAGTLAKH